MKHHRWFPWLELACAVACIPLLLAFSRVTDFKHLVLESYSNRSPAPISLGLSIVVAIYITIRLMFIHVGLVLTFPLLVVTIYVLIGAILLFLGAIS